MFYNNSPLMKTPYLDASNDTPFIDAISPPFIDTVTDFNQYPFYPLNINPNDICIASYLPDYSIPNLPQHPVAVFNGDPSLLIIDKSKTPLAPSKPSPAVKLENVGETYYDNTLFPPLSQDIQENTFNMDYVKSEELSLDELLGFDVSSPLSEVNDDEEQAQEVKQEESKTEEPKIEKQQDTSNRKRKSNDGVTVGDNAAAKKPRIAKNTKQEKFYQCPLCNHKSKRRYNLTTHIKTHDKNRIKEFDCSVCSKSFDRRHDRDRHLATVHRKERTHGCEHCINQFSRRDALNRHLVQKHGYNEADLED